MGAVLCSLHSLAAALEQAAPSGFPAEGVSLAQGTALDTDTGHCEAEVHQCGSTALCKQNHREEIQI